MRRSASAVVCGLLLASLSVSPAGAGSNGVQRWAVCGEWRQVPVHTNPYATAVDIAVVSPYDAWMTTYIGDNLGTSYVYRWTGLRWEEVASPTPSFGHPAPGNAVWEIDALAVVDPTQVWAVGAYAHYRSPGARRVVRPLTARWDGTRWQLVPVAIPHLSGHLLGVASVPGTDRLWAVGVRYPHGNEAKTQSLILRWNGAAWHRVPSPNPSATANELIDVAASGHTAIAVGESLQGDALRSLAMNWNGRDWVRVAAPSPKAGAQLSAVTMTSPTTAWAVGEAYWPTYPHNHPPHGIILGWNGRRWTLTRMLDRQSRFTDVVGAAYGDVWAVGQHGVRSADAYHPIAWHRTAAGWAPTKVPSVNGSFSAIDGTPHNLWVAHREPHVGEDLADLDTYHRC